MRCSGGARSPPSLFDCGIPSFPSSSLGMRFNSLVPKLQLGNAFVFEAPASLLTRPHRRRKLSFRDICVPKLELGNEEVCKPSLLVVSIAAMRLIAVLGVFAVATLFAQPTPEPKSDVSNKALITKSTPVATTKGG